MRTLAFLGLALLYAAAPAIAQDSALAPGASPPSSTDLAQPLAVRVHALYLAAGEAGAPAQAASWEAENVKYTTGGSPAPFKLVGPDIVVFVGVTPFVRKDGKGVVLIAEGQVGVKRSDGGFSYQATVSTIQVQYGENVLFLPLGLKSPLRVEIAVFKAADLPPLAPQDAGAPAPSKKTGK